MSSIFNEKKQRQAVCTYKESSHNETIFKHNLEVTGHDHMV